MLIISPHTYTIRTQRYNYNNDDDDDENDDDGRYMYNLLYYFLFFDCVFSLLAYTNTTRMCDCVRVCV